MSKKKTLITWLIRNLVEASETLYDEGLFFAVRLDQTFEQDINNHPIEKLRKYFSEDGLLLDLSPEEEKQLIELLKLIYGDFNHV